VTFLLINIKKYREPLGYDTKNVLVVPFNFGNDIDGIQMAEAKDRLLLAMKNMEGIETFSFGAWYPVSGTNLIWDSEENGFLQSSNFFLGDEEHAKAMGFQFTEGRWYTPEDKNGGYQPIVINQKFKDQYYPDEAVAGKTILWGSSELKITGVIDHYKYFGEFEEEPNVMYMLLEKGETRTWGSLTGYIKLKDGTPPAYEESIDEAIQQAAGDWTYDIIDLDRLQQDNSRTTWAFLIAIVAICGFLIFNVALGLFGVIWYNTSKRRGEIGLRRAIGATKSGISRHFIGETFVMATLAILIGLFFAGQLPLLQVVDVDLKIYLMAMVLAVLFIYTLVFICSVVPSQQAAQIHPATALHEE